MDNDNTGDESNDSDVSNDGASSNSDGSSVKGEVTMGGEGHRTWVDGSTTYHDFTSPDESTGTDTISQPRDFSSRYSLGVDLGTGSQSESLNSRYSLGIDTSLSGDSKSQADRAGIEKASYSIVPRSEGSTSRFSLGIETNSTTSSGYSLGVDRSLGIGSESTLSRFSLGILDEPTSFLSPLRTGEKTVDGDKPAEKLPATPRKSNIYSKNLQQQVSPEKTNNLISLTDKVQGFIQDIGKQIRDYAADAFKLFENGDDKTSTNQVGSPKQQIVSPQKGLLSNPVPEGQYGSSFGLRQDPFKNTTATKMHWGLDIKAPTGTPVLSAGEGKATVITGHHDYGNFVVIDHGNGLQTAYAHMDSVSIKNGESVKQGQEIGKVGNTGRSKGPHLHFEVRSGDNRGSSFHSKKDKERYYKDPKGYIDSEK
jgi:murein DD-endopeptidase MepM/ murein hydrolase activator NlpD